MAGDVVIQGDRLVLRALRPAEVDAEWQAMVAGAADSVVSSVLTDEAAFRARLARSGHLRDGWLDLAIDLDGTAIGRVQTFVPRGRALPPGTFDVGIGLREHARGKGYGREALTLFTDWLFEHAAAEVVESATSEANHAMRRLPPRGLDGRRDGNRGRPRVGPLPDHAPGMASHASLTPYAAAARPGPSRPE